MLTPTFTQHVSWLGATFYIQAKHAEHFRLFGGMNSGEPPVAASEQTFQATDSNSCFLQR